MKDMLIKLYDLPKNCKELDELSKKISFRRPLAAEKSIVNNWVKKRFGDGWESEVDVSFSRKPITTFIAIEDNQILGFATYDAAYLNFLGPMGVEKSKRKKGLGKALLFLALSSMKEMGYAYAIIGGVGPAKFYEKTYNAKIIEGSDPGIYKGILSDVPV
ncbi:MAG TPA: GNAT family N-acetyltransferase [Flavobacteriaceae bacterium]|jgi:predicted acetyltransferase|nr:GNAT family N-acetyltransferase [Flavobacteriaceae bacterium]|tara:strand:- start:5917 stop:6396 length:480 start_codon:yes stop_codon:yes gene_type:complete